MPHPDALHLQAHFDNELDALATAEVERHLEQCAECRAVLQDFADTRAALRRELTYFRAPPVLRTRLTQALDAERTPENSRRPPHGRSRSAALPFWAGAASGGLATAVAVGLAVLIWAPPPGSVLVNGLVGAHLRSLMSNHLVDVLSTDKHTVKPWFAGHTDVSPVVADFTPQGYRLLGGRADYLDRQRAAVVVYQHGQHVINVFSWAGHDHELPADATRNGYHFVFWRSGDLQYCAVSDTAIEELLGLVRLLQGLNAGDARG